MPAMAGDPQRELFLIDGNSLAYRAFFALPESIATSTGMPTNAIFGFASMLVKILTEHGSVPTLVVWDAGLSGRREQYGEYKAQRLKKPDLLSEQWPSLAPLAESFGYENVSVEGYEADDVIASLCRQAVEKSVQVMIVTGDRDAFQLIEPGVRVMATSRGITETKVYDREAVIERYGIPPELIPDFYGLKGDTSDNIPGVPGIGDKTASQLLQRFGDLETVLASVDEISGAKRKDNLLSHAEDARVSKALATAVRDVAVPIDVEGLAARDPDRSGLREAFRRFELREPLRRIEEALGEDEVASAPGPSGIEIAVTAEAVPAAELASLDGTLVTLAAERAGVPEAGGADGSAASEGTNGSDPTVELTEPTSDEPVEIDDEALLEADLLADEDPELLLAATTEDLDRGGEPIAPAGQGPAPATPAERGPLRFAAYAGGERVLVGESESLAALSLAWGERPVVAHDWKSTASAEEAGLVPPLEHDTMVAAYLIDPARRIYPLPELTEDAGIVARVTGADGLAERAVATRALAERQREILDEQGLMRLFEEIELPLVEVLLAMERTGMKVDTDRLGEIEARFSERIDALQAEIHEMAGGEFTIGSPQQLAEILFERLGLSRKRRGKTGFSTDARVLAAIRDEHPIIERIERWRELTKLKNTYLDALPELISPVTGRLHTTFNQTTAATGRLSSTNPNLQNIPIRTDVGREIRSCFVAEPGHLLISADYSQVELRILAHIAGEETLRQIFARGEDVHAATSAEIFNVPLDHVDPGLRSKAKMVNYGIVYGLSAFGLADRLQIPQEEAADFIERYLDGFPAVRDFMAETIEQAKVDAFVTTLSGRKRRIPEIRARQYQTRMLGERLAVNTVIQGTAADIIKVAMVRCYHALAGRGLATRLVLQIHDELLFEAPEAEVEVASSLVRAEMVGAFALDPPLAVDVGVGPNWLEAK
jgi:DNA polymerase-1